MNIPYNFGGLPKQFSTYRNSSIVILPIPFDKTTTWLKGSHKGPKAIIDASRNIELYDITTGSEVYKKGIFTEKEIVAASSLAMVDKVYKKVKDLLQDNKFVVTLGGEHSVSLGAVKAYAQKFGDLSILHLDAHTDRRDSYDGSIYNHACVMARAGEIVKNIVSVGIRSMDSSELAKIKKEKIFYAQDIYKSKNWIKKAQEELTKKIYLTIDLDVFESGIMPSTGTPEPGGLSWYQVIELLEAVAQNKEIVGFDVVELCPSQNKAPDFLAAELIYRLLSYIFYY